MKRTVLIGLALISGAALAALWAASPACEGALCLGTDADVQAEATAPEPAPRAQVETVDLERIWAESAPARRAPEPGPAVQAEAGPEGLEGRQEQPEPAEALLAEPYEGLDGEEDGDLGAKQAGSRSSEPEAVERWEALVSDALAEPDDETRGEAIHAVGNLRDAEAVAVLSEAAAGDPDPGNRLEALQSLWFAAADGLDADGQIRRILEAARSDPDPGIAELAQKAVADLDKLEARRDQDG